ncbi:MAG: ABC transporter ATP-binding protein [Comamonas sp.]
MFLEVSQLDVRYANRAQPAVQQVSLQLQAGDIGVLIGPSGCGKTTLLRAVAGLEPISAGQIKLSGAIVSSSAGSLPPEKRRIGMVFQDYALFPHLSVGKNVAFGIHDLPKAEQQQRVSEALALVGLEGSAQRYPHELSGGQQQRVALARALAPRPQLMLLDEPFSNLDVDLRERLAHELRDILKAANATALFVTHDQLEAFAIGDQIGVMQQGQLHQWADAATLYHLPATRFVADFIGHGAFVPATPMQNAQGWQLDTPLGAIATEKAVPACDVLLRAGDVVVDAASPYRATLVRKSFRGSQFLYTLELADKRHVYAQAPSDMRHAIGESVNLRAQPAHLVSFAPQA